jgi:glutamate dehydrogenase/leucine dehydrogenase
MDNGEVKMINGFRIQYNDALGPTKGGVRFHESVNEHEVVELSFLMSLKTSLMGIPYGGAKGGIKINPKELSESEIERVSRGYVHAMYNIIGPHTDIPAPDVNTNSQVMAWMMDEYEKIIGKKSPGAFTGKPIELGGSLGRSTSTSRGAFYIINERFKSEKNKSKLKVAIQGFGNAGYNLAKMLYDSGFCIVAVSDSHTGIYNSKGLNIDKVFKYKKENKTLAGFKGVKEITNEELLELKCEILIPAALGGVITGDNVKKINAKFILEVSNAPISSFADDYLEKNKVEIVPDILANSGGVIVSYFEWVQNLQNFYWTEDEINEKLKKIILDTYAKVIDESKRYKTSLRTASYTISVNRILEAEKLRGHL